ncbi:MAG: AAA family ATPase [Archangium sp.]|nr:AAA family ATPase [Archangium sp.]
MRFDRLEIQNLRAVLDAKLELGPGLNVLYGPNDLGKSTLAEALRALLLYPATGDRAESLVPWQDSEAAPEVSLTFHDASDKVWRVLRRFTTNIALLEERTADGAFSKISDKKVDDRLRGIFAWGLSTGTRKQREPASFLTHALLGRQDDVTKILHANLEDDVEPSGQARIAKVLSSLARDPLVIKVLATAEKEVAKAFTPQGKRKAARTSELALALDEVERLETELEERQKLFDDAQKLEKSLRALEEKANATRTAAETAEENVRASERRNAKGDSEAAQSVIEAAKQQLAAHDELVVRKNELEALVSRAQHEVGEKSGVFQQAASLQQQKSAQVTSLEASERDAKGTKDASKRAVTKAELESSLAQQQLALSELTRKAEAAKTSARGAEDTKALAAQKWKVGTDLVAAKDKLARLTSEAELTTGIIAYGQWRKARDARGGNHFAELNDARAAATKQRQLLEAVKREVADLQTKVSEAETKLPDASKQSFISDLRRELDLAEAALGGGFTVQLKPRSEGRLRVSLDDGDFEEERVRGEKTIEADRRANIGWGDSLDFEVIAGAPEKRREVDHLKKKWRAEAVPLLELAGLRSKKDLDSSLEQLASQRAQLGVARARVKEHESEVARLDERVKNLDEKSRSAPSEKEIEERKARIGRLPLDVLEQAFTAMGERWEIDTSSQHAQTSKTLTETTALVTRLEGELQLLAHRLDEANAKTRTAPTENEAALTRAQKEAEGEIARIKQRLASLDEGKAALDALPAQLKKAKDELAKATTARDAANAAFTAAQGALKEAQGELKAVTSQVMKSPREKFVEKLEAAKAKAGASSSKEASAEMKALKKTATDARAAADRANAAYASSVGALERVGGATVPDRLDETKSALARAQRVADKLSTAADGWKLLHETAKAAEKELSSNFGAALAGPVSRSFSELTKGRYGAVTFDSSLQAQHVDVNGSKGELEMLSVGTRDQLATLVRLALATHLKAPVLLDDQLVHSDASTLAWFRPALLAASQKTQVLVLTCRPLDYVAPTQLPKGTPFVERDGVRVVDLEKVINRR